QKRFEIALVATIPVGGGFISAGPLVAHRLLMALPFWIILIGFALNSRTQLRLPLNFKILPWSMSARAPILGLMPSIRDIPTETKDPAAIDFFKQQEVAVARFLKAIVAGKTPPSVPRLEHDEFNRVQGIPDPPYETLICAREAKVVLELFVHDYDIIGAGSYDQIFPIPGVEKILSFFVAMPRF